MSASLCGSLSKSVGRNSHLISVIWDNGVTDYAYPFEIEITDEEEPRAGLERAYSQ